MLNCTVTQAQLFQVVPEPPKIEVPGFTLRHNYITPAEEQQLLAAVENGPWETDWRRRVQQYGVGYGATGGPHWVRDFPDWLLAFAARVHRDTQFERFPENSVINEYIPPLGIAPHRDYPAFGPTIACVSLGSDVILDLIAADKSQRLPVHVPARSLWVLTGPARTRWLHGIAPRLNDIINGQRAPRSRRVSITFRTAKDPSAVPPRHHAGQIDQVRRINPSATS